MNQLTKAPAGLAKWQMTRALDYIEQHLPDKITVAELRRRLALACMLLKTTREPLSQVALSCGLYDHAHFSRVFRRGTGMNPAAWRRANAVAPGLHRQGTLASLESCYNNSGSCNES